MCIRKKVMAAILVATMAVGMAFTASAATASPVKGNENFDAETNTDANEQDHINKVVDSTVVGETATVKSVKSEKGEESAKTVTFNIARDAGNKAVPITDVAAGVFNSKKGQVVTKIIVKSKAAKGVTFKASALKGSKVKTIIVKKRVKKVTFKKNAFKGTKAKTLTLNIKKASQLVVKKGALKGLKKIKIKGASKKQKAKLIKKLRKAGFKKKNIK